MKNAKKSFDCVQMKWGIQRRLRKRHEGLSLPERRKAIQERVESDLMLGPWLRRVAQRARGTVTDVEAPANPAALAEQPPPYKIRKR